MTQDYIVKDSWDCIGGFLSPYVNTLTKSGGIDIVEENMLIFSISHVTSCDHVIRIMWFYYWLHLTICQHSSKCGGYTSSELRNIWFLVRHMTSCNRLVRRTYDFLSYFTSP